MQKVKVGEPIKFEEKEYQFYSNESPLDLPNVRFAFLQEQLAFAINTKTQQGEMSKFVEFDNYHLYSTHMEQLMRDAFEGKQTTLATVKGAAKGIEELRKSSTMRAFIDMREIALEPSVMACCYILFLEGEPDDPTTNLALKKQILYSDIEQLSFFLNFLYKESKKSLDSEIDLGSFLIEQHRKLVLSPEWSSVARTMKIRYPMV